MNWKKIFLPYRSKNRVLKNFSKVESSIYEIFSPVDRYVGQDYFLFVGPKLCELTGADFIMIGKYNKKLNQVDSFVFCNGSQILDNVTYSLENTPCEKVVGNEACSISEGAWEKFSKDIPLVDKLIEGYIGIPLFNMSEEPTGIVVALFQKPICKDIKTIESLIHLFTPRMSTEIQHFLAREELSKRNVELELMHRALKDKNKKLDDYVEELRKTQLKSKEYDQLKSTFLANLSHEIRTPMNVILGFLELLRSDSLSAEERVEYVDIVNVNGTQLLSVMDNLIDISKLQTRLMQEDYSKIILNDFLSQLQLHYQKEAKLLKKDISIDLYKGIEDGRDFVIADQEGLQKVLKHLMDNALKFTKTGGSIEFGYDLVKDNLRFYVKDNGIGVPKGKEEIIFDMFRQANDNLNRDFGGNGLGLAISKKYIETLGGEIWLDSAYTNGACFYFTIPYERAKLRSVMTKAGIY